MPKRKTYSRVTKRINARNLRAARTRKASRAKFELKRFKKDELLRAAGLAQMVANAAHELGIVPVVQPEAAGGAGAPAPPAAAIMDQNVDLEQAAMIMHHVADLVDDPAPIHANIDRQVANVRRRGCQYRNSLKNLFYILMNLLMMYSATFPITAPPSEATFFDTAAGYLAMGGTAASLLSLESSGFFTACSIGTQFAGAATRAFTMNQYPMSLADQQRELLKFMEYYPGAPGNLLKYTRYGGLGYLGYNALKDGLNTGKLWKLKNSASKAAVNVATEVGERLGVPRENTLGVLTRGTLRTVVP